MSVSAHIHTLLEKHAILETEISIESARPLPDFASITRLKKQKLNMKEEIVRLREMYPEAA